MAITKFVTKYIVSKNLTYDLNIGVGCFKLSQGTHSHKGELGAEVGWAGLELVSYSFKK